MLPLRRVLVATSGVALCMLLATVSLPLQTMVLDLMPILNRMLTWPNNASQAELSSLAVSANFSSPLSSMAMYVYNDVYDVIVLGKNEPIIPQLIFPRKPLTDASLPPSPPLFGVMVSKNATLAPQGGDGGGGGATRLMVEEVIFGSTFPPSLPTATVLPAARTGAATTRGRDLDSSTSNRTAEFQPTPPTMIGRVPAAVAVATGVARLDPRPGLRAAPLVRHGHAGTMLVLRYRAGSAGPRTGARPGHVRAFSH
ncbi:unnamed protein product [Lampetra fluviatilis]